MITSSQCTISTPSRVSINITAQSFAKTKFATPRFALRKLHRGHSYSLTLLFSCPI